MSISVILMAAGLASARPHVIASQTFDPNTDRATSVELIERPQGITDADFAQKLIDASGLRPWNGQPINFPASPGGMGVRAVESGAGPEVHVYFVSSDSRTSGRVCRITRKYGGMAGWPRAQDWCASKFGLPPRKWEPPIKTVNVPIRAPK